MICKPRLAMVFAMAMSCSSLATVILAVILPLNYWFSPGSILHVIPWWKLLLSVFVGLSVALFVVLMVFYLWELTTSWIVREDGILIQRSAKNQFVPWAEVQHVDVALYTLCLRRDNARTLYLNFVFGPQQWNTIPPDKRRAIQAW
jgi:membrane protein YdbS with pleckstrin-like domain